MRTAAKHPKAVFDEILEDFIKTAAKKSIMVAMKTNLKGVERGTTKARAKFGGNVTQISDVVRATVVVSGDVKDLYDAVILRFLVCSSCVAMLENRHEMSSSLVCAHSEIWNT